MLYNTLERFSPQTKPQMFAILLVAVLIGWTLTLPASATEEHISSINVSGTGSVSVAPDMAMISFGVVREAEDSPRSAFGQQQGNG